MSAAAALLVGMSAIDTSGSGVAGRLSDADASALARQVLDGTLPELQVRWALLAEVRQSEIAASVASGICLRPGRRQTLPSRPTSSTTC